MIFTIGRMNPPTSGHQGLIRKMMEKAVELGLNKIYIILSGTIDNKKNPLNCEFKKDLLVGDVSSIVEDMKRKWIDEKELEKEAVEKVRECKVIVVCMNDPEIDVIKYGSNSILKCIHYLLDVYENGNEMKKSFLFVGEDRGEDYRWISKSKALGVLEINPLDRPEGAISATYIRSLAIEGKMEDFLGEMEKIGMVRTRGEEVYEEIRRTLREGLNSNKKKTVKSDKIPKSPSSKKVAKSAAKSVKKIPMDSNATSKRLKSEMETEIVPKRVTRRTSILNENSKSK